MSFRILLLEDQFASCSQNCPAISEAILQIVCAGSGRASLLMEPGGVLPSKWLLGMCRWMGSHFRNWTDYNEVTFLAELLEWGRTFLGFLG